MNKRSDTAIIILAAGLGTRMKSDKAKVLHDINNRPMIEYVVETAVNLAGNNVIVVVGYQAENVKQAVSKSAKAIFAYQDVQLGTGHAARCALPYLPEHVEMVVILCGDVPLLSQNTLGGLIDKHEKDKYDITVLAVNIEDPTGYGRIIVDENNHITKIVEEADASSEEKKIKTINSGIYCVTKDYLEEALNKISSENVQEEYYLTDIIEIGNRDKKKVGLIVSEDADELMGVNSYDELQTAEKLMLNRNLKTT